MIDDIESVLDYHLRYEVYKEEYNSFVDACIDDGSFKFGAEWDEYEARVGNFKIPPIVTISDGNYTLTNVPVGKSYNIYQSTNAAAANQLPGAWGAPIGSVAIPESGAGQTYTP